MIEEARENPTDMGDATRDTTDELAEALDSAKAASPAMADALNAAVITPEELADAHERVAPDEHATSNRDEGDGEG